MDKDELLRLLETDRDVRQAIVRVVVEAIGPGNPTLLDAIIKAVQTHVRSGARGFIPADAVGPTRR